MDAGKYEEALTITQRVLQDDPRSTFFHYIAGRCYFGLKRMEEAESSLMLAKDTDASPHRCLSSFNEFIRVTAQQQDVYLFDAEKLFVAESEYGIPGHNLFFDDCHPTPEGHRLFAKRLKELALKILRLTEK